MGMTVSGLVNGLDPTTIVSQLMQSESIPQQMLQNQQTSAKLQASTYRAINTKFQAVLAAAQAITNSTTWTATTASASATSVGVASTGSAQAGSLTFAVSNTAQAETLISSQTWSSTSASYGLASPVTVYDSTGASKGTITVGGSGTLADAVSAINASGLGLSAAAVQTATGQYQLQITATGTGLSNKFTLSDQSDFGEVTAAADATLKVGTGTGAYTVTSPTNTFTGLMPGVTLTVSQKEPAVTVTVAADPQSVGDKMKALIDAANAAIQEITTDTDSGLGGNTSGKAGVLAGDYTMQSLAQQVRTIVSSAIGSLGSAAQAGVQLANPLDPSTGDPGTINFDEGAFVSALKTNPSLVQSLIKGIPADNTTTPPTAAVPGIAAQLATLATNATDSVTGTLTTLASGEDALSKSLQSQIDDWTTRLADIKQQLTATYTNMQSMLSSLQNQQSWLSSMFNSLTGASSSSSSSSSSSASSSSS